MPPAQILQSAIRNHQSKTEESRQTTRDFMMPEVFGTVLSNSPSCLADYFPWPQVALTHHVFQLLLIRSAQLICQAHYAASSYIHPPQTALRELTPLATISQAYGITNPGLLRMTLLLF